MRAENILYGRTDLNMSGPGIVMLKTAGQLACRGHKIVVASSGGPLENDFKDNGIIVHTIEELAINKRSIRQVAIAVIKLMRVLKKNDIEIVHGHNMFFTLLAYVASIFLSGEKVKFFTTIHGHGKEWVCNYLPGKIIVVSFYLKNRLVDLGVSEKKISVVPNGLIDMSLFRRDKNIHSLVNHGTKDSNKFTIINVAMMLDSKGHYEAICVLKCLIDHGCNIEMLFVGDGIRKSELIDQAIKKGVYSNIKFLGVRRDVPDLLLMSDLFLHLPDCETFGMVVMEAMAAGLPVIATDAGAIPELVKDGWNGFLFENNDTEAISSKVMTLIEDKKYREILGNNALKTISDSYQIKHTIRNLEDVYG